VLFGVRAEKLHRNADPVSGMQHRSLYKGIGAQLSSDFRQSFGASFQVHSGLARYQTQAADSSEFCYQRVGNPIREIFPFGIAI